MGLHRTCGCAGRCCAVRGDADSTGSVILTAAASNGLPSRATSDRGHHHAGGAVCEIHAPQRTSLGASSCLTVSAGDHARRAGKDSPQRSPKLPCGLCTPWSKKPCTFVFVPIPVQGPALHRHHRTRTASCNSPTVAAMGPQGRCVPLWWRLAHFTHCAAHYKHHGSA